MFGSVIWLLAVGCSSPTPPPVASPAASASTIRSVSAAPPSASDSNVGDGGGQSPEPVTKPPVLATESLPPGVEPLSKAEEKEVKTRCQPLLDALVKSARSVDGTNARLARLQQLLAEPPTVAGVSTDRCAPLLRRQVRAHLATALENQAIINLRRILFGLASALGEQPPRWCPSAPAVPAKLDAVASEPYRAPSEKWQPPGWQCVRFALHGQPQHFQYTLTTDAAAKSYEIVARGYPVKGHQVTELFVTGQAEDGSLNPAAAVYRR